MHLKSKHEDQKYKYFYCHRRDYYKSYYYSRLVARFRLRLRKWPSSETRTSSYPTKLLHDIQTQQTYDYKTGRVVYSMFYYWKTCSSVFYMSLGC